MSAKLKVLINGAGRAHLAELFQAVLIAQATIETVKFKNLVGTVGDQPDLLNHAFVCMPYYQAALVVTAPDDAAFKFLKYRLSRLTNIFIDTSQGETDAEISHSGQQKL